jgi:hypothetical protein
MKIFRALALLIALYAGGALAQTKPEKLINGQFNDIRFREFVRLIEAQTDYYFYYDASKLDNLQLYMQVKDQPLRAVLAQVFNTQLPSDSPTQEVATYTAPDNDEQEKLLSTAENKLHEIGPRRVRIPPGNSTVSGYVRNAVTGEPVIGAAVYLQSPQIGVTTDVFGYYSLTIPRGRQRLLVKSVGMRESYRQIMLYSDGKLDIELLESVTALKEVPGRMPTWPKPPWGR